MSKEFTISEDKLRGIKTVGWFLPDGRLHVQTRQYVPDRFFDAVKAMRDKKTPGGRPNTQQHWRHVAEIPETLYQKMLLDENGRPLHFSDPEREKRVSRILNDIDYRDLRVVGGSV